jgi:hypothetical protein
MLMLKPCVRCGYCCTFGECAVGRYQSLLKGVIKGCAMLKKENDGRYICLLADTYQDALFIGVGCAMPLNPWRKEKDNGTSQG